MKFGSPGKGDGEFSQPRRVAVDDTRSVVYVADSRNNRIQVFDTDGNFITQWGTEGVGNGQFVAPTSVVLDPQGNVIVGERGNHRIQKFDPTDKFLMKFGFEGSGDGQFSKLEHIAVDQAGDI